MKRIFISLLMLPAIAMVVVPYACSKSVEGRTDNLQPLQPSKTDADAGSWKTILLASASEYALTAPIATTSPDYTLQINEVKTMQQNMTDSDRDLVKYWSAGAVLRWNEIMRELVAKHNLPPYQNPDGTYPAPDANNPLAYPFFPFSNPPYAARAYGYVSAATYDALVAGYYYKKLYNRPAPYNVNSTLNVLIPKSDLPAYPSEDGVVEGVTVEMLDLLFPGDQDYIHRKADEHKRARMITGANVRSDIEAGEALGKAVAQKFIVRARNDRAGQAGGNQALWTQLENNQVALGQTPWISLEGPKRPPMLPLFGKVKGFLVDSLGIIAIRPAAPPSTSSDKMKQDTKDVLDMINNDTRDHYNIVHYWADGAGTTTPAGHWNAIASDDFIKLNFSEVRWARNMALLNMALMDAAIACWDAKYYYFNPRPSQTDPNIKTLTGVPNFPSYISGHATFSSAAATVLSYVLPSKKDEYTKMAIEAGMSRYYAGIHFKTDCDSGISVGTKVGNYAVQRALIDGAN